MGSSFPSSFPRGGLPTFSPQEALSAPGIPKRVQVNNPLVGREDPDGTDSPPPFSPRAISCPPPNHLQGKAIKFVRGPFEPQPSSGEQD